MPITAIIVSRSAPATIQPSFGIEGRTHGHNRSDRDVMKFEQRSSDASSGPLN
jgi:hypothetical protein